LRNSFTGWREKGTIRPIAMKLFFTMLCACLLAGCGTNKEKIIFNDNPTHPGISKNEGVMAPVVPTRPKKLEYRDQFKIDVAVYGYLLQRHFWDDGEYSAIFLQGEDAEVDVLIKKFPDHIPPIKTSNRAELRPNRTPVDRDTGRPAMILSVEALDPTNETVEAIGSWYAGGAVSGFYGFELQKVGDDWIIQNVTK
jgi:hypothetical protein